MCVTPVRACRVEVVRDVARLRALEPSWEALARHAVEPNVFYESWMLLPAIELFARDEEVCVALVWVRAGEDPTVPPVLGGLFPLVVGRFRQSPFSAWKLWKYRHCYLCTPLVRSGMAEAVLGRWLAWLREGAEGPQMLELGTIPADGALRDALDAALRHDPFPTLVSDRHARGLLRLGPGETARLRSPGSAQLQRALRRKERRLEEMGLRRGDGVEGDESLGRWIEDFLDLEARGWKGRAGTAIACSEPNRRYFREVIGAAHRRGRLLAIGFDAAGAPIARRCSFTAGEGSFAFKTAYDEAWAKFSPGVLLERDAIRQAAAQPGLRWMDSCTTPDNQVVNRLWCDRRSIESLAIGAGAWEKLLIASFPMLRRVRRLLPEHRP